MDLVKTICKSCITAFFSVVAIFFVILFSIKFFEYEIGTRDQYEPSFKAAFPTLTFCSKDGYKVKWSKQFGINDSAIISQEGFLPEVNDSELIPTFNRFRYSLTDILTNVTVRTIMKVEGRYLHHFSNQVSQGEWSQISTLNFGHCFSHTIPESFRRSGIARLRYDWQFLPETYSGPNDGNLQYLQGIVTFIHHQGQFSRAGKLKLLAQTASIHQTEVVIEPFVRISDDQRCSDESNLDFDQCWKAALKKRLHQRLGCIPIWHFDTLEPHDLDVICKSRDRFNISIEAFVIDDLRADQVCRSPCQFMSFETKAVKVDTLVHPVSLKRDNLRTRIILDFAEETQTTQEYQIYPFLEFLGEAGGFMGLLLGASCYKMAIALFGFAVDKLLVQTA